MLRLTVQLINETGKSASTEYGLYVKHRTLDYINEDRGVIESFVVPKQDSFRETYVLSSVLDGYVGWAWRKQFVEAAEKIVGLRGGNSTNWKALGSEVPKEAGRIDELYYSTDFVGGISLAEARNDECMRKMSISRMCVLNTLSVGQFRGYDICSAQDLEEYYASAGLSHELENFLRSECGISDNVEISGVNFSDSASQIEVLASEQSLDINAQEMFQMSSQEFARHFSNSSNVNELLQGLKSNNAVREGEIKYFIRNYLRDVFGSGGCSSRLPAYSVSGIEVVSIQARDSSRVALKIRPRIKFLEDYLIQASIATSFEYNCTQSWSWGNFSQMDYRNLAECMYNWDDCMGIDKGRGMYEAASAGYGPLEATPTLENDTARILLDGKLTQEKQSRNITVYKSCAIDDAWVAPQTRKDYALLYACPYEAWLPRGGFSNQFSKDLQHIGKPTVSDFYPRDASEGQQYKVLKCDRAPSMDESEFVEKVPLGSFASLGLDSDGLRILYICKPEGWVPWKGVIDNCTDPNDPNCLPYYCEKHPSDPLCINCTGPTDPRCKKHNCNDPNDPNCKSFSDSGDFEMFEVIPIMVNAGLGQGNFNVWNINILNQENRTREVELYAMCKDYPAAINWIEFTNSSESCGEGCKKTTLTLPGADKRDLYRSAYASVHLATAGRLGSYEFQFFVKEKSTGKEIYRKNAWLNVFTDAVGGENLLGLVMVFLGSVVVITLKAKWK